MEDLQASIDVISKALDERNELRAKLATAEQQVEELRATNAKLAAEVERLTAQLDKVRRECERMYVEDSSWPHQACYNDAVGRILACLEDGEPKRDICWFKNADVEQAEADLARIFMRRLSKERGSIVSSADCSPMEIAQAQADKRFFVDGDSLGYVLRTVDESGICRGLSEELTEVHSALRGLAAKHVRRRNADPSATCLELVNLVDDYLTRNPPSVESAPQQSAAVETESGEQFTEQDRLEKKIRIKYQDIVYAACNAVDALLGGHITRGTGVYVDDLAEVIRTKLTKRIEPAAPAPPAGEPTEVVERQRDEIAKLKAETERLEKLVTTRERHRLDWYKSKSKANAAVEGDWKISWYEADDDEPGCSGYMLSVPRGATREQAEAALRAIEAMAAIRKFKLDLTLHESGNRWWSKRLNAGGRYDCSFDVTGEASIDPTEAVLSLAAQLTEGGA